jgi:hypothetical protein
MQKSDVKMSAKRSLQFYIARRHCGTIREYVVITSFFMPKTSQGNLNSNCAIADEQCFTPKKIFSFCSNSRTDHYWSIDCFGYTSTCMLWYSLQSQVYVFVTFIIWCFLGKMKSYGYKSNLILHFIPNQRFLSSSWVIGKSILAQHK